MRPKLLFLFPECWDRSALRDATPLRDEFEVLSEGFDLFRFPENARLLWLDARAYIDRLVHRYRRARIAGVVSTNEQYGALIAARLARELGLPGTDPLAVVRGQHKILARQLTSAALPHASPRHVSIPWTIDHAAAAQLPYPLFVKPVKAAYSVLARRVDRAAELISHLEFGPWEKHIIRRLVKPFNDLMRDLVPDTDACDAHHLIGEEPLEGVQVNVDGFVDRADPVWPLGMMWAGLVLGVSRAGAVSDHSHCRFSIADCRMKRREAFSIGNRQLAIGNVIRCRLS